MAGLAVIAAIAGCAAPATGPESAATPEPTTPAAVANRSPLPPCGQERRTGQAGPVNAEGRPCLWEAYLAGRPAEFVVTALTVEGDPVTDYWRVLGPGSVELIEDSTRDPWASGPGWMRASCGSLVQLAGSTDRAPAFDLGAGCREAAS